MHSTVPFYREPLGLLTDLYQLTMAQGYWRSGHTEREAVFHLYFRKLPFQGGYAVACGLGAVIDWIASLRVTPDDLAYLATLRGNDGTALFAPDFLAYLGAMEMRHAGALIDMRRRERCWLNKINSSLLGWHLAPSQLLALEGWYEAGKIHEGLWRDMVRSKSEVIIANMLHERGITFYYEKPLYAPDGTMYLPDFTVVWNGEGLYWEHVGRLNDPKYVEKWTAKRVWYEKHFPGKLRTSYEKDPGKAPGAPKEPLDVSLQADEIIRSF